MLPLPNFITIAFILHDNRFQHLHWCQIDLSAIFFSMPFLNKMLDSCVPTIFLNLRILEHHSWCIFSCFKVEHKDYPVKVIWRLSFLLILPVLFFPVINNFKFPILICAAVTNHFWHMQPLRYWLNIYLLQPFLYSPLYFLLSWTLQGSHLVLLLTTFLQHFRRSSIFK